MAGWGWDFPVCNHLIAFPGIQNIMIMDTGRHRKPMKLMVCLGILGEGRGLGIALWSIFWFSKIALSGFCGVFILFAHLSVGLDSSQS